MDLAAGLQQLEDMVTQAKSMPLSSSALLNRDEVLELLSQMSESLPEEIKLCRSHGAGWSRGLTQILTTTGERRYSCSPPGGHLHDG